MSSTAQRSNLEIVKGAYDAFGRGAIDEVTAAMDEHVEWIESEGGPTGGIYHGPRAVVEGVFAPTAEQWSEFRVDPERFVEDGDTVVALGTYRGTHGGTGRAIEVPFAHVLGVENGRIVRFQQYADTALLNEAASA